MLPIVRTIAEEFKEELQKLYGEDLSALILFGSHARGDFHEESDIDFAVVLKSTETNSTSEISKISIIGHNLSLKHQLFLSYISMSDDKLKSSNLGLYREVRKDGVRI